MTNEKMLTIKAQMETLLENTDFCDMLCEAQTIGEIHALLNANQVDVSLEDVAELVEAGAQVMQPASDADELDLDMLENVSGGVKWGKLAAGVGMLALYSVGTFAFCAVTVAPVPGAQAPGVFGVVVCGAGMGASLATIDQALHNR